MDPGLLAKAVDLVRERGAVAQLCVMYHGEVVLDQAFGCRPDALFWIWSASKPYTALLVHELAAAGLLGLDDPVAKHWPEFAGGGKGAITIRQVLQHRSGLASAGSLAGDALAMTSWRGSIRRIERVRPGVPAGGPPAYSPIIFGFILGELLRRVTGEPVDELLRTRILVPLGVTDTYLGLPKQLWHRHVPIRVPGRAGRLVQAVVNRRATRRAVIPAAGISTTARDLASFYRMLLAGGAGIIRPEAIEAARTPSADGVVDRVAGSPIRWAQGFQLGGRRGPSGRFSSMGAHSSPRAFGHNGSNCCIGWADPDRGIAFAYLTDLVERRLGSAHHAAVADCVIDACTDQV